MAELKKLIEYLAKNLVDLPDQIKVEEIEEMNKPLILKLHVANSDFGKIIGRKGRTAGAFRILLNASGSKLRKRCILEVVE